MPFPCSVSPTVITPCAPFHVRASEVSLSRARVSQRHHLSLIPGGGRGCRRVWGSRPVTWGPWAENRAVTPLVPGSDMGAHRAALLPETPHLALLRPLGAMVAQPWGHVCPSSEGLVVASPPKPTAGAGRWVCAWGQHYVHGDSGMCVRTAAHVHGTVGVCMETVTCVQGQLASAWGQHVCARGQLLCVHRPAQACTGQWLHAWGQLSQAQGQAVCAWGQLCQAQGQPVCAWGQRGTRLGCARWRCCGRGCCGSGAGGMSLPCQGALLLPRGDTA